MQFKKFGVPLGVVVLVALAYRSYGWAGVAMAAGALVMWVLLHFTRMLQVLKRAANRPVGSVASAVMLHDPRAGRAHQPAGPATRGVSLDGWHPVPRDLRVCRRKTAQMGVAQAV
jgi:hypothetical protein